MRISHNPTIPAAGFVQNAARFAALLMVVALLVVPALAQTAARLEGRVQDPSGAVVANAKISALNLKTQKQSETTSTTQGLYVITPLDPGLYKVTVEAGGFQKTVLQNLEVNVGATVTQVFSMKVGQAVESVIVEASAVSVETTDSQLARAVTMRDIDTLPQLGRTPITLAVFQPGVQINPGDVSFSHVNGQRGGSNNSKLDGIDVNDSLVPRLGLALTANNTDSVGEFRVVTEGGKAEYGRSAGAQVELITRSGTNQYHGSAFDYLRNTVLNANDYFNNLNGTKVPKLIQNIYGGSFGGPVIHDKTFIFGNFQGRRTAQETVRTRTVLSPLAKQGIFQWTNSAGVVQQFNILANDPRAKGVDPAVKSLFNLLPDPNNSNVGDGLNTQGYSFNNPSGSYEDQFTIKGDHNITKNNKAFLRWSWQRNSSIDALNNADAPFPGQIQGRQGGKRWGYSIGDDWTFGSSWANEFRFGHQSAQVVFERPGRIQGPQILPNSYTNPILPNFGQGRNSPVNDITDNMTKVHNSHTFKWGTSVRFTLQTGYNDAGIYPNVSLSSTANGNTPVIPNRPAGLSASQTTTLNNLYNDVLGRIDQVVQTFLSTDLTSFQPGGTTRQRDYTLHESGYYFQDDWRVRRNLTLNLGIRYEFSGIPNEKNGIQATLQEAAQIDGTPLTSTTITRSNAWYKNDWNNFAPRVGFAWDIFGDGKTALRGNFGMFYDRTVGATVNTVDGNTPGFSTSGLVTPNSTAGSDVRISDGIPLPAVPGAPVLTLPVSTRATSVVIMNPNLRTGYVNSWNLNVQRELVRNTVLEVGYVGNRGIKLFMNQDLNQMKIAGPFMDAFKELQAFQANGTATSAGNVLVKIFGTPATAISTLGSTNIQQGNVGAAANTLDRNNNAKYAAAGLPQTFLRAYPQYNQVVVGENSGRSYYDALQISVRRSTGALKVNANYTYSHSLDNITVDPNGFTSPIDNYNVSRNRSNGDFDHRHSFNSSVIYALPFGKGQRWGSNMPKWADALAGGWELGSLIVLQDGVPFSVSSQRTTTHVSGAGNTFTYADYSGDHHAGSINYRPDGSVFFYTAADIANFAFPAAGTIGTSARNGFRGPHFTNVDSSLVKHIKITERQAVTFRAEAYNLFNHPNFSLGANDANGNLSAFNLNTPTTFGKLASTLGSQGQGTSARTMQLTLRYDF